MSILNLTQHKATPEQIDAGVIEPANKETVKRLLTFDDLPSQSTIIRRAQELADIADAHDVTHAMIGGARFLMAPLQAELYEADIVPLYAFSVLESVETTEGNGRVIKKTTFCHAGFMDAV